MEPTHSTHVHMYKSIRRRSPTLRPLTSVSELGIPCQDSVATAAIWYNFHRYGSVTPTLVTYDRPFLF